MQFFVLKRGQVVTLAGFATLRLSFGFLHAPIFRVNRAFSRAIMANEATNPVTMRYDSIIKPEEDKRFYRALELSNKMKVLLVSDPTTDKSAAAMDVNVGYLSDPDNVPGLAHFCEHMLFLGTKKYPKENEYNKFLSEHGGGSNAFTSADHTTYYFDVMPQHLHEALDIFAQFFIAPLLTESATERELNAIESEHDKNRSSDNWRLDQLNKSTADPNHVYSKFGTGNRETLETTPKANGVDVRQALIDFHDKWYSADIMGCAILGKESLDELEAMAAPLLSLVQCRGVTAPSWNTSPYPPELRRKRAYVLPVKELRSLSINIPVPDWTHHYKSGPDHYISHLVGHEGPGSLLSALRKRGWCNSLVSGVRRGARGFSFFGVQVDLTEEGSLHTDSIITLVFQYLEMLRKSGLQRWIWEEQRDIHAIEFRFRDTVEPRSLVSGAAHTLQEYPPEEVLSHAYLLSEWREELVRELLDMLVPDNMRVGIVAKCFKDRCLETEPWYGTKYLQEDISEEMLEKWRDPGTCDELHLPLPNEFVPSCLDLAPREESTQNHTPSIIRDTPKLRLWYKQDNEFLLPKAIVSIEFTSPLAYSEPQSHNLMSVWCMMLKDSLVEYAYAAELAGLRYHISNVKTGFGITIEGHDDKIHVLLDKVLGRLSDMKLDPSRFLIMKESYERIMRSAEAEQPYKHAVYHQSLMLTDHAWSRKQLEECAPEMTLDMLEAFVAQVMRRVHCEALMFGNLTRERALALSDYIENRLPKDGVPLLSQQLMLNREVEIEKGSHYLRSVENSVHRSSCASLYFACGRQNNRINALLDLLLHTMSEPCFNTLRTQEQLGYIVFSGVRRAHGVLGVRVIVQSDRRPHYVEDRIEAFLHHMSEYLADMPEEELRRHRSALRSQLLEKPKKMIQRASDMLSEINSQQYNFERARIEADILETVGKDDVLQIYKKYIQHDSTERRKISVHIVSTISEEEQAKPPADGLRPPPPRALEPQLVTDLVEFKSGRSLYPTSQPYVNIPRKGAHCKL